MKNISFASLNLKSGLLDNLATLGYHQATGIQQQSLPAILEGRDVIAQAQTGSGKTAAFGLGLLQKLEPKRFRVQSLVLCPTRELADQVSKEIRKLGRGIHNIKVLTLCGGAPFGPQINSLEHGAHIIVGTPGRVEEHLRKGNLVLNNLTTLVLDEADRMLDMGFQQALDAIVEYAPKQRQTLLFSATFPDKIAEISQRILMNPVTVKVESDHDQTSIAQYVYQVDDEQRIDAVRLLLMDYRPDSTVIFCNTRRECQEVANQLKSFGFAALALHGDLEQKDRDQTLVRFANKSISVLVATDVAARGLDIDELDLVINFHIAKDLEVHTHRIGRTGRAGSSGVACTLVGAKQTHKLKQLEQYLGQQLTTKPLPNAGLLNEPAYKAPMATLQIDGGRKQKVRAGDIVGALTAGKDISGDDIGKISLFDNWSFVAVKRSCLKEALHKIEHGKLKGRSFRVRHLRG